MRTTQKRRPARAGFIGAKERQLIFLNTVLYSAAFTVFMWQDFAKVFQWLAN
jgi:hypothetical protein